MSARELNCYACGRDTRADAGKKIIDLVWTNAHGQQGETYYLCDPVIRPECQTEFFYDEDQRTTQIAQYKV